MMAFSLKVKALKTSAVLPYLNTVENVTFSFRPKAHGRNFDNGLLSESGEP